MACLAEDAAGVCLTKSALKEQAAVYALSCELWVQCLSLRREAVDALQAAAVSTTAAAESSHLQLQPTLQFVCHADDVCYIAV
jgi:hypothetical protein